MVVTTVHQTFLSPLLTDTRWDVVIVDEASMIPPVSLYVATGLGDRAIIAGDFRQLPPVVLSRSAAANAWLRRDAFDVVGIPDDVERGDYPPYLVMLTQQYRMAPGICELVSDAYDGQLTTDPGVIQRPAGPLGPHDVLFVDSGQHGARVEVLRSGSRQNATNVAMTESLLERMLERRVIGRDELRRVMVITPFVAQAELYYETLRKRFGRAAPGIRTVHRSQGREADIVLLDLVDARNEDVSRFLRASSYRSEGGRLLTVGVTRARQHLIVIADFEHLLTAPDTGSVARHILQRVVATGKQIRPRQAAAR
jgi:superfamily I DNA and/or RNA helicase